MVDIVGAITSAQNSALRPSVQDNAPAQPTPPPPLSSIDFVTSGIYVDNLQNVAILEYRSSQTGDVIQQYPNQAQINAFKAAQQLARAAQLQHQELAADHHVSADTPAPAPETTGHHVSAPPVSTGSSGGGSSAGSASKSTTSVIA